MKRGVSFRPSRIFGAAVVLAVAAYIAVAVWKTIDSPLETARAAEMTVRREIDAAAFVIRDETVFASDYEYIIPLRREGEQVSSGAAVAEGYFGGSKTDAEELRELRSRISVLQEAGSYSESRRSDKLKQVLGELSVSLANRELEKSDKLSVEAQSLALAAQGSGALIDELSREAAAISPRLGVSAKITSPGAGIIRYSCDGFERASVSAVKGLTPDGLRGFFTAPGQTSGIKTVSGSMWYLAAIIDSSEVRDLKSRGTLTVSVPLFSGSEYKMTLTDSGPSENGQTVVLLKCTERINDTFFSRETVIRIVADEVHGYAVPREAVRYDKQIDGDAFIYVADVYTARRVPVTVNRLADEETYIITPYVYKAPAGADEDVRNKYAALQRTYDNGLALLLRDNMEIVVRGRNLSDGKIIR